MTTITIDLSEIFNETGYINKGDHDKYVHNHNVTHIILVQSNDSPIKIGNEFLISYNNLISVDATEIVNVIAIGNYFLFNCRNLTVFDTTKLTSLTTIGDFFLGWCYKLTIFDATKLSSLTTIGNEFLSCCYKLTIFDATKLSSLITIGKYFLCGCNENLTITIKNPSNNLHDKLLKTKFTIIQLYNIPVIHLVNNCVI